MRIADVELVSLAILHLVLVHDRAARFLARAVRVSHARPLPRSPET
jgi:hypothetical protein